MDDQQHTPPTDAVLDVWQREARAADQMMTVPDTQDARLIRYLAAREIRLITEVKRLREVIESEADQARNHGILRNNGHYNDDCDDWYRLSNRLRAAINPPKGEGND